MLVAVDGVLAGMIELADQVRPASRTTVTRLRSAGALRVVGAMPGTSSPPSRNGRPHDIEGTAVDVDSDSLDPPR